MTAEGNDASDGLREALDRALASDWGPASRGLREALLDVLVTTVTAWAEPLRAKADAADRVRELAEELDRQAPEQEVWDGNVESAYSDIAGRIRRALDGPRP